MSNPLITHQQPDMTQALQQLRANPMQVLQQAGLNIPQGMNDPNAIIRHLLQSGQVSQEAYAKALMMARQQFRR